MEKMTVSSGLPMNDGIKIAMYMSDKVLVRL